MRSAWPFIGILLSAATARAAFEPAKVPERPPEIEIWRTHRLGALGSSIAAARAEFGDRYARGVEYAAALAVLSNRLESAAAAGAKPEVVDPLLRELGQLRDTAMRDHPLVRDAQILVVRRRPKDMQAEMKRVRNPDQRLTMGREAGREIGFPSNHECNSSLERDGYDNEIVVLSWKDGAPSLRPLYRPPDGGYVGEIDLDWDAKRLLFTRSTPSTWRIGEIGVDGAGLRDLSPLPEDVHCFDPCRLPDGGIIFGSTATFQSVPCWHGLKRVTNLYRMDADGSNLRQLCFDQDHDLHPVVLANGQVMYSRWDYTGISHIYLRMLMAMNPDGTGQRAVYGSNSWFPNSLYFPRELPGRPGRYACILSGYHGPHRMGQLVILDASRGWKEGEGIVQRLSGEGQPVRRMVHDNLVQNDWPKFLTPFPLDASHILVSVQFAAGTPWALCLADTHDTLAVLHSDPEYALLEPVPLAPRPRPPAIPPRIDLARTDAQVYLQDIHTGPGLAGVPRGTVKALRLVAYHFGYLNMAGPDKVGRGGPWEVMRIVGTVPVEEDGSAFFRVPANTPLAFQALDAEGRAVQLMRSWYTAMPGETVACAGCHEPPPQAAPSVLAAAARRTPREVAPWRGPVRGFDFAREVQPVLDRHCAGCHDGTRPGLPDLRREDLVKDYRGLPGSKLDTQRMHPSMREATDGLLRYTPAYEALVPRVRRVGIEDQVSMLVPGEYHAGTSPLVQMLERGHHGVTLAAEDWDRLVTWIDLNAPCHGTWGEVFPIPDGMHERRMALRKLVGGPADDPEAVPKADPYDATPVAPAPVPGAPSPSVDGWPFARDEAVRRQAALARPREAIDLGGGVTLDLVAIPGGRFVMGDPKGTADEHPPCRVGVAPFLMGACEISNEQFARFDAAHDSGHYGKRHAVDDDIGLPLNDPRQPALRVSWKDATAFCRWLSARTGRRFSLPTEAQWEYAARAGSAAHRPEAWTDPGVIGRLANTADASFTGVLRGRTRITGGLEHLLLDGAGAHESAADDGAVVTAPIGSFGANAWGLHDMAGNVAEWTRSARAPYPYMDGDGRNDESRNVARIARGGSFFDPPARCGPSIRTAYPAWQRVFNVGFRVVCEDAPRTAAR
jgi:formylglycine-generating enzyme required for sulfatase activity